MGYFLMRVKFWVLDAGSHIRTYNPRNRKSTIAFLEELFLSITSKGMTPSLEGLVFKSFTPFIHSSIQSFHFISLGVAVCLDLAAGVWLRRRNELPDTCTPQDGCDLRCDAHWRGGPLTPCAILLRIFKISRGILRCRIYKWFVVDADSTTCPIQQFNSIR